MRLKKNVKITIISCISLIMIIALFLGYLATSIYYNAEILSCELYADYIYNTPYYSFKIYGNGKIQASKFIQPERSVTNPYISDPVTGFAIENNGECYMSLRKCIYVMNLILQLNRLKLRDSRIAGTVPMARISFGGKSSIQQYSYLDQHSTEGEILTKRLIDALIKNSPIEVKLW
ncbi:MAG: hypothetical protein BWY15_01573 [Firmicutes bacterium ADurb.Bin193]|nr:MAG: hypothetical protein BWY15_01573 [Firmicutes bacterium ADurb.Bin193]